MIKANLVQGGDGTAIPSGMVGYSALLSNKNIGNLTDSQFFDGLDAPFTLPTGKYLLSSVISTQTTGTPTTLRLKNYGIGTAAGNSTTGIVGEAISDNVTSANYLNGIYTKVVQILNVTNASQNYYLKGFSSSTGTPGTVSINVASVTILCVG